MKYSKGLIIILLLGIFSSCNKRFDRLLVNPNGPTAEAGDVDAFLNQVQISFNHFYAGTGPVTIGASDFGDVPYLESNKGLENINPKTDGGQEIYNQVLALIDTAIVNLNNPDQDSK